ncbi:hypothetical protein MM213_20325 [Belliella sp. R4-6]|uniref:DUF3592 domain-containing protein n=1 Tax=Belliella alkalica TaxID=1730871 RepID=A0ABS9VHE6_9BACT|nr:hypothetical protein [Belliella alkalica]MCH7415858.1 hypothetical protein [Belliella alkalica]
MKIFTDRNFRTFFLVGMGIYFIVEHGTREHSVSTEDLIELKGKIIDYSFKDNTGWRRQGQQYYIYLDEYPNKFQIKADYLRYFDKEIFKENFESGTILEISFPKYQEHLIGTKEAVLLTSLSINSYEYISQRQTIEFEKSSKSSNSDYLLGIIFIILGVLVFLFHNKL